MSLVEVSKSNKNIESEKNFDQKEILGQKQLCVYTKILLAREKF